MHYEMIELPQKTIRGLYTRASRKARDYLDMSNGVWIAFYANKQHFADNSNKAVYGVYTNYSKGNVEYFDLIVGKEDKPGFTLSGEAKTVTVPAGKYAKFIFRGDVHRDLDACWQAVLQTPLERTYTVDFEEYPNAEDFADTDIHIYISLLTA